MFAAGRRGEENADEFHTQRQKRDFCKFKYDNRSLSNSVPQKWKVIREPTNGTAIDGRISAGEKIYAMSLRTVQGDTAA